MMKKNMYVFISLLLIMLVTGCDQEPDIPAESSLVFTTWNYHAVTTWVNGEPVLICDGAYTGYNQSFWQVLQKGENKIYFTAKRLPDEIQKYVRASNPDNHDDSTTVKIIKGNIFDSEDILVWKVTGDIQTSPVWTVSSDIAWRPSLGSFDTIEKIDDKMKTEIQNFLILVKQGLESKNLSILGIQESDIEELAKAIGLTDYAIKDVFGDDEYEVFMSPFDELEMIHGKKTIMVYRPDGEKIFDAGRSPEAESEDWKLYYRIGSETFYFVKENGKLKPLWPKVY